MKFNKKLFIPLATVATATCAVTPLGALTSCAKTTSTITSWDFAKQGYFRPGRLPRTVINDKSIAWLTKNYFERVKADKNLYITDFLFAYNAIAYSYDIYKAGECDSFVVTPDISNITFGDNDEVRVDGSIKISIKSAIGPLDIQFSWQKVIASIFDNPNSRTWELSYGYSSGLEWELDNEWKLDAHIIINNNHFDFNNVNKDSTKERWFQTLIGFFRNVTTISLGSLLYTYNANEAIMHDFSTGKPYTPTYNPKSGSSATDKNSATTYYFDLINGTGTPFMDKTIFAQDCLSDITMEDLQGYKFNGKILFNLNYLTKESSNDEWRISYDVVLDGTTDGERVLTCLEFSDLKFCVEHSNQTNDVWYSHFDYEYLLGSEESTIWDDNKWQIGVYAVGGPEEFIATYVPSDHDNPIDKFAVEFLTCMLYNSSLKSMSLVTPAE